jgi:hypothetical protein
MRKVQEGNRGQAACQASLLMPTDFPFSHSNQGSLLVGF